MGRLVSIRSVRPEQESYVVYQVKYKDEVVYIGEGKLGRQLHAVSGTSHCYELNKLHFTDPENVKIEILEHVQSKNEAESKERLLISRARPRFNRRGIIHKSNCSIVVPSRFLENERFVKNLKIVTEKILSYYTIEEVMGGIPISSRPPCEIDRNGQIRKISGKITGMTSTESRILLSIMGRMKIFEHFIEDGITWIRANEEVRSLSKYDTAVKAKMAKHAGLQLSQL